MNNQNTLTRLEEYMEDGQRAMASFDGSLSESLNSRDLSSFVENVHLMRNIDALRGRNDEMQADAGQLMDAMEKKTGLDLKKQDIVDELMLKLNKGNAVDKNEAERIRERLQDMTSREEGIFSDNMVGCVLAVGCLVYLTMAMSPRF